MSLLKARTELLASINQYRNQLSQCNQALSSCKSIEMESLESLKRDLTELLSLTEEQLNELDHANNVTKSTDPFEDEMQLFLSEIRSVEQSGDTQNSDDITHFHSNNRIEAMKTELNTIVGKKFSAPHIHSWGSKAYHNAFVCSLDDTTDYDEDINLDNIKIKVLFINPTHREMVPCPYYLDGNCKFDADKCHFSHGELVLYSELKEYKEPDFQLLQKAKYPVLVKQNDRIWYKGRLISSNFDEKTCKVKLEQSSKEISCEFHDVLPIHEDAPFTESSDSESNDDEYDYLQRQVLIEKTLLSPSTDQALGEWEKYTKGFGSKMMQKFGYVLGQGLGNNGEGIVVPISIQILPQGKSLDHCMELRERSNGDKDLFSVERKLKKQQKKQEQLNIRAYERDRQSSNVFNFINDNVFASLSSCSQVRTQVSQSNVVNDDFKNHSTKNLNVAGFKIAEDIKKLEKDIQNVKDSMARQQRGTAVFNKLSGQLSAKSLELFNLKKSEKSVATEQIFRKDKSKLTIF